jgi:hypothetical protein
MLLLGSARPGIAGIYHILNWKGREEGEGKGRGGRRRRLQKLQCHGASKSKKAKAALGSRRCYSGGDYGGGLRWYCTLRGMLRWWMNTRFDGGTAGGEGIISGG